MKVTIIHQRKALSGERSALNQRPYPSLVILQKSLISTYTKLNPTMTTLTKAPTWYWIVSAIALIWNGLGVMAYITQVMMTPEALAILPEAERALYNDFPAWYTGAFAIAVFGGALGSLALLLRKASAYLLFIISFIGLAVQMYYNLVISTAMDVYGPEDLIMPIMVAAFGIGFIFLAKSAKAKGWIG
ncbi:MAG: hypothetical protein ACJAVY_002583 [Marinoscillum sp.]